MFRRKRDFLRLKDFDRMRPGARPRWVILLDRTIDLLCTRTARRVYLCVLVMFSLVVVKHQRDIDAQVRASSYVRMLALADSIGVPVGLSDFQREETLSQWQLVHRWDSRVAAASKRFGVPEKWIRAVMLQESGGRTMMGEGVRIVSPKGAMGLMQVMPDTYRELRKAYGLGDDPHHPDNNIAAGAAYLRLMHDAYGFKGMFAAYNAGPGRLALSRATGEPLPLETQNYVERGAGFLRRPDLMNPAPVAEPEKPMLVASLEGAWQTIRAWF